MEVEKCENDRAEVGLSWRSSGEGSWGREKKKREERRPRSSRLFIETGRLKLDEQVKIWV